MAYIYYLQIFFEYHDDVEKWEYSFEDALDLMMQHKSRTLKVIDATTASLKYPWDLFEFVETMMEIRGQNISDEAEIAESADIKGDVIIEDGAKIYDNARIKGPAYIGKNSVVGDHALIRDHVALEENTTVGAKSEIKNTVIQPNSSIHSGFIGDSVIGQDAHVGAETVIATEDLEEKVRSQKLKLI